MPKTRIIAALLTSGYREDSVKAIAAVFTGDVGDLGDERPASEIFNRRPAVWRRNVRELIA